MEKEIKLKSGKKIIIQYDDDAESPRCWDNLGTIVTTRLRDYSIGDEEIDEYLEDIEKIIIDRGAAVTLPLYMYAHSGVAISTSPFGCRWDSGQIGFIYMDRNKILSEFNWKRLSKKRVKRIIEILDSEVDIYNTYISGEVYGYTIESEDGSILDSCCGFIGGDHQESGIIEYICSELTDEEFEEFKSLL
jgi:hypothetical protein